MNTKPAKIYVAAHKAATFPDDPGYIPIHAGKAASQQVLDILGDDTGDNISSKNPYYSECTALYWIAKNTNDDFVGLMHYRRYLAAKDKTTLVGEVSIASSDDFGELASDVDLVVSAPLGFINDQINVQISVEHQYFGTHIGQDLYLAREAVLMISPDYIDAFDFTMRNCQLIAFNIFVGKLDVVKAYTDWLFSVLFQLEQWIPYKSYGFYQERVFAFLAERLFTVWIVKNRTKYKVAYRPLVAYEPGFVTPSHVMP